jgi:hypothetical protein
LKAVQFLKECVYYLNGVVAVIVTEPGSITEAIDLVYEKDTWCSLARIIKRSAKRFKKIAKMSCGLPLSEASGQQRTHAA